MTQSGIPRRPVDKTVNCLYEAPAYKATVEKSLEEPYCEEGENALGQPGWKLKQFPIRCSCESKVKEQDGSCPDGAAPCEPKLSKSFQLAAAPFIRPVGYPSQYFVVGRTEKAKQKCESDADAYVRKLPCNKNTVVLDNGLPQKMGGLCRGEQRTSCTKKDETEELFTCVEDPVQPNRKYCCTGSAEDPKDCQEIVS